VGEEGTGTIQFRLDHTANVFTFFCVTPRVEWGESFEEYPERCQFRVDQDNTIDVKYTYQATGAYTTKARLNVGLVQDRPPDNTQFPSTEVAIAVGASSCELAPTPAPVAAPPAGPDPTQAPVSGGDARYRANDMWTSAASICLLLAYAAAAL